jgi:guanylate kinase
MELAAEAEFDAVVVNDDVGHAAAQLVALIEAAGSE